MNRNLIITSTVGMSADNWLKYRKRGLGASEIGTVLGLNPYKSKLELFYDKVTLQPKTNIENIAMFMGHYHEAAVADLWQYWDGSEQGMIDNYRKGNKVRKCRRINAYVSNPKYPWLFASLDRIINKGNANIHGSDYEASENEGALEIKTIAGYEADKWEAGIPPSHLVQVITQMLVCEFQYGEIAAMKDGRYFSVWPFNFNPIIAKNIVEQSKEFWESVIEGRKLMTQKFEAEYSHNIKLANECQAKLDVIEPEPDGSESCENFLKEKYKKAKTHAGIITGTPYDLQLAKEHKADKEAAKVLEQRMREFENTLKRRIADGNTLDFGKDGKVTWQGEPRRFNNKIKL